MGAAGPPFHHTLGFGSPFDSSLHKMFTSAAGGAEDTVIGLQEQFATRYRGRRSSIAADAGRAVGRHPHTGASRPKRRQLSQGEAVIKNKLGALAGCALLAIGIAACGSSSKSGT